MSPLTGDVWGATELGLFRYSLHAGSWRYFTRADGLPSDQADCLAFAKDGTLYVGTLCDGIAVASPKDDYHAWRAVSGPANPPDAPAGAGLPSPLINALLVSRSGTVYAATDHGLAHSDNGGRTWRFLRGVDWSAIADGGGTGRADNADLRALEILPLDNPQEKPIRIHCGGPAVGDFAADTDYDGGQSFTTADPVSTEGIADPAPAAVYETARWGSFTYRVPHLVPGAHYRVRLHFAEVAWTKPGQRVFDVSLNGQPVLTRFDIFAEAGGKDKAIVREFTTTADAAGKIVLAFQGAGPLLSHVSPYALAEDYVTALGEDGAGHLYVGHRQAGLEAINEATGKAAPVPAALSAVYVDALLPTSHGHLLVGTYGDGLQAMPCAPVPIAANAAPSSAPFPAPAAPPSAAQLTSLLHRVQSLKTVFPAAGAAYLGEDWQTQGDWVGRYGRQYAMLCSAQSPFDQDMSCAHLAYYAHGHIGPHAEAGDGMRRWVTWADTEDPRALYDPYVGHRRQAEWDDHGEDYPRTFQGPDLWIAVNVPAGLYHVSLYIVNKDGHTADNRDRDYTLDVLPHPDDADPSAARPVLAHARIRNFWGGVYERFALQGPGVYDFHIGKNGSINSLCSGVFIDKMAGPDNHWDRRASVWLGGALNASPPIPDGPAAAVCAVPAASALWSALTASEDTADPSLHEQAGLLAYRAAAAGNSAPEDLASWRRDLKLWGSADRTRFADATAKTYQSVLALYPQLRVTQR